VVSLIDGGGMDCYIIILNTLVGWGKCN
jgi:hypothetical protein